MRHHLGTDNGAPCPHCRGTVKGYRTDTTVSLVDVTCYGCRRTSLFALPAAFPVDDMDRASRVSAAERAAAGGSAVRSAPHCGVHDAALEETCPADAENGPCEADCDNELVCYDCLAELDHAFLGSSCIAHRRTLAHCMECMHADDEVRS